MVVEAGGNNVINGIDGDGTGGPHEGPMQVYRGPAGALAEETPYKITIVNATNGPVQLMHRDPNLIRDVSPVRGQPRVLTGTVNFRSQVGQSEFEVLGEAGTLKFSVEVRPTKLDYESDYGDLVDAVAGLTRQLVLEYLRATHQAGSAEQVGDSRLIDWLILLRHEYEALSAGLRYIVERPYSSLSREPYLVRAERVRRPSSVTRRAVSRGKGEGSWLSSAIGVRHRELLPTLQAVETLDNPEHRWLRQQLSDVTRTLAELGSRVAVAEEEGTGGRRSAAIRVELREMEEALAPFLDVAPLSDATTSPVAGYSSLVLSGRPGYREAYQALMRLRMSLFVGGEALKLPLKDISDLYEIWCFLQVVALTAANLNVTIDPTRLVEIEDRGTRLRLVPGKSSAVSLPFASGSVTVAYNREYRMLTGRQRPDIVIEVNRTGLPPVVLLLDAKYRIDTSPEYAEAFGGPGPPIDAIGQLHRYRDAIAVNAAGFGRGRPVVRGAALFPLNSAQSGNWEHHRLFASLDDLGIGALPFLPTNTEWVAAWIQHALMAPDNTLAWPGPPFLAWEALHRT